MRQRCGGADGIGLSLLLLLLCSLQTLPRQPRPYVTRESHFLAQLWSSTASVMLLLRRCPSPVISGCYCYCLLAILCPSPVCVLGACGDDKRGCAVVVTCALFSLVAR